jgi:S-methylmethionine-dependent homocysteine/selenocysteine methylase
VDTISQVRAGWQAEAEAEGWFSLPIGRGSPEARARWPAAQAAAMPVAISFTLETDGRLPSGDTLDEICGA